MAQIPLSAIALALVVMSGCSVEDPLINPNPTGAKCYQPISQVGIACVQDFRCVRGASCYQSVCRVLGAAGGGCETTADCEFGLFCSCGQANCTKGKTGTCHQPGALKVGELCIHSRSCSSKICNREENYTCQNPGTAGMGCLEHEECAAGLVCILSEKKCRTPLPKGEPCAERWECAKGLSCVEKLGKHICTEAYGALGFSCLQSTKQTKEFCGGELVCNLAKGSCDYPAAEGGICGGKGTCKGGLVCNIGTSPGKCAKPASGGAGGPCSGFSGDAEKDCQSGLICLDKKCTQSGTLTKGEVCKSTAECVTPYKCLVAE